MDDAVKRYRKRRDKRIEARYDGLLDWITLKNGVHVPIKDGEAVGGPVKGEKIKGTTGKKLGEKRKQISVPKGTSVAEIREKAVDRIREETGYSEKEASKFANTMTDYFGGNYKDYTEGRRKEGVEILDQGLSRMGAYDGEIYRGMSFPTQESMRRFMELDVGDELSMKSISSWTSDPNVARKFAAIDRPGMGSVMLSCKKNTSGVGVQHLSKFGENEAEVLVPSTGKWRVTGKKERSKADVANEVIKDLEKVENPTKIQQSLLNFLKSQMKINRRVFDKSKYMIIEVEEI